MLLPIILKRFVWLYLLTILLLPFFGNGQTSRFGKITGVVYNAQSGKLLSNANIVLLNTKFGTISGANGSFTINNLPVGLYNLQVSYLGFKQYQKSVDLVKNPHTNLQIFLTDTILTKKEVRIVANSGEPERQIIRSYLIPLKKIDNMPVQNIADVLDYLPGVTISNTFGIFSTKTSVTMRGLPSNSQGRVLVLLDGIPMNKSDEGSVNWNLINKNNIESIKVLKGPGPAMYGSGSMGGVIEMTSKKPYKKITSDLLVDYGTYHTMGANLNLSGLLSNTTSFHNVYWGLFASGKKSDGYISDLTQYTTDPDSILAPIFLKEFNANAKLGYSFKKKQNLEMQFGYYNDMRGNGFKIYEDYGANSEHDSYIGNAKYSGSYKKASWNILYYLTHENYKRLYEYLKDGEYQLYGADSKRDDQGINASFSLDSLRHNKITTGINYRLGSVDGEDIYYTSTDIISNAGKMAMSAAFIQDEISLFKNSLHANVGLRYEYASFYDGLFKIDYPSYSIEFYSNFTDTLMSTKHWDALCPKFSVEYLFKGKNRLYFSAAKGFTAPILDDLCRTGKKKGGFRIANPNLKPELLTNFELGLDFAVKKNIQASASVYYSLGKDFLYYISTGDSVNMGYRIAPIIQRANISAVEIYGFEFELKYDLKDSISVFANYSYSYAEIKNHIIKNPLVDIDLTGKQLTDLPNHKVSTGITWKNKIVNATLLYKYISKTWINDQNLIDSVYFKTDKLASYSVFSIKLDRRIIKNLVVFLSVENIFNKFFITTDAQRSPGRFFSGGFKYSF